ncbi:MAG: MFS transporter [Rhodobacteraceae bacterium]|nr:MFS transporter [Paracoccaceae bacterium]
MTKSAPLLTPVLIGGSIIILISFAIRSSFGLFQIPIADDLGWLRAEFSLAIAIQNLAWGIGQPIFGAIAEKYGDRKAIILGIVLYAVGLALSAVAITPGQHNLLEVLVGFGVAGTGFGVILAIVGRASSDENRSLSLGIATAAGSGGQIVGPPAVAALLAVMSWQSVFLIMAGVILAALLFLPLLRAPARATKADLEESLSEIIGKALRDPSFTLIFVGFFSCGYQLGFITAHFPAFVTEVCGPISPGTILHDIGITTTSALGAWAMALIGVANIAGTIYAGWLGARVPKKYILVALYSIRTLIAAIFILLPMTPLTVIVFSIVMGSTWLATVPVTAGLVGYIYGLRYMGTLYGIVFFSHQLGSFLGVWLGGWMYDLYGSYDAVWWIGVGVGAFSAIVHLPVREQPLATQPAAA